MKDRVFRSLVLASLVGGFCLQSFADQYLPPPTAAELEIIYAASIQRRAVDILQTLALTDEAKSNKVQVIIMTQYRTLKSRDDAMEEMFRELGKNAPGIDTNRVAISQILSRQLHDNFIAKLSAELTPEQVEKVKDKMTYNKVKVTFDAYCEIVPNLTETDKAKTLELLKAAREEAMDGGSANEKSDTFQKYKNQINSYLDANGHDVAKAYQDWNAKQANVATSKSSADELIQPAE